MQTWRRPVRCSYGKGYRHCICICDCICSCVCKLYSYCICSGARARSQRRDVREFLSSSTLAHPPASPATGILRGNSPTSPSSTLSTSPAHPQPRVRLVCDQHGSVQGRLHLRPQEVWQALQASQGPEVRWGESLIQ